jgi:hypothetical protein
LLRRGARRRFVDILKTVAVYVEKPTVINEYVANLLLRGKDAPPCGAMRKFMSLDLLTLTTFSLEENETQRGCIK